MDLHQVIPPVIPMTKDLELRRGKLLPETQGLTPEVAGQLAMVVRNQLLMFVLLITHYTDGAHPLSPLQSEAVLGFASQQI